MSINTAKKKSLALTAQNASQGQYYSIPLLGLVHLENEPHHSRYNIGEVIENVINEDRHSITLCAADTGLVDAGILPGDFLTVDLKARIRNGDIAAIHFGDKIFVRKLFFQGSFIRLETCNDRPNPLVVDPDLPGFRMIGKVTTVFREL